MFLFVSFVVFYEIICTNDPGRNKPQIRQFLRTSGAFLRTSGAFPSVVGAALNRAASPPTIQLLNYSVTQLRGEGIKKSKNRVNVILHLKSIL
jgi:hypothetical protein